MGLINKIKDRAINSLGEEKAKELQERVNKLYDKTVGVGETYVNYLQEKANALQEKAKEQANASKEQASSDSNESTGNLIQAEANTPRTQSNSTPRPNVESHQTSHEQNIEASSYATPQVVPNRQTMFSRELEALIQATLEDGVLEDYEKAALVKRAQSEGVDLAELEIYINSILQKRQKELNKEKEAREEKHEQAKKEALGPVCPKCGKQVPPLTLVCECGYEFTNKNAISSIGKLSEEYKSARRISEKKEVLQMIPIPNTKEDIIEFLVMAVTNSKKKRGFKASKVARMGLLLFICVIIGIIIYFTSEETEALKNAIMIPFGPLILGVAFALSGDTLDHNELADAWKTKAEEILLKGRSLRSDPEFQRQLDYYENLINKR